MLKVLIFLLMAIGGEAQAQQKEQIQISASVSVPCPNDPAHYQDGNQYIFLENYTDTILPSPAYIRRVIVSNETPLAQPDSSGNFSMAVDTQMHYAKTAGFPAHQYYIIQDDIKTLSFMKFEPNGSVRDIVNFDPPIAYRAGDGILIAPECTSPSGRALNIYVSFSIEGTLDFISDVAATPAYAINAPHDTPSGGAPPLCIRNLIPAPSVAATSVRFHLAHPFNWNGTGNSLTYASKVSVGLQAGNSGPNMTAPQKLMARNGIVGTIALGQAWTDWTPINVPAGQNVLGEICLLTAGNVNNFSFASAGSAGDWISFGDSSNSTVMLNSPVWQPGRSMVIDRAQFR